MSRREAVGIGLVVVGLGLHFWNARREARPLSLSEAVSAPADRVDPGLHGRLVAVTGNLETALELGDPKLLVPGRWIRLTRIVEMYCWKEILEGGQPRYTFDWVENPQSWREFRHRNSHQNPSMPFWSEDWRQPMSRIGPYAVNPDTARLPAGAPIPVRPERMVGDRTRDPDPVGAEQIAARMVRVRPPLERLEGDFLYVGPGSPPAPAFGDVRVSWRGIESGQRFTAIGEQRGDEIVPQITDSGQTLWSLTPGERGSFEPRPASVRWGLAGLAGLIVLAGLAVCLGRAPLPILGGLLAQVGAVIAFFVWPMPAALLAAAGLAAAALTRLGPR